MSEAVRQRAAWAASVSIDYQFRLYVAGPAPRSIAALRNLEQICTERLAGHHRIVVIDLLNDPHLAQADNILAVPTLVRTEPGPVRKIIGNLANAARVLSGLDLGARETNPFRPRHGGSHG